MSQLLWAAYNSKDLIPLRDAQTEAVFPIRGTRLATWGEAFPGVDRGVMERVSFLYEAAYG